MVVVVGAIPIMYGFGAAMVVGIRRAWRNLKEDWGHSQRVRDIALVRAELTAVLEPRETQVWLLRAQWAQRLPLLLRCRKEPQCRKGRPVETFALKWQAVVGV